MRTILLVTPQEAVALHPNICHYSVIKVLATVWSKCLDQNNRYGDAVLAALMSSYTAGYIQAKREIRSNKRHKQAKKNNQ